MDLGRVAGGSFAALIRGFHARAGAKSGVAQVDLGRVAEGSLAALIRGFHARVGAKKTCASGLGEGCRGEFYGGPFRRG